MTTLNQKIEKAVKNLGMTVKFQQVPDKNGMNIFYKNGVEMKYELVHMFLFRIDNRMTVSTIQSRLQFTIENE